MYKFKNDIKAKKNHFTKVRVSDLSFCKIQIYIEVHNQVPQL